MNFKSNVLMLQNEQARILERHLRIAKEFSNLIVYCRTAQFDADSKFPTLN